MCFSLIYICSIHWNQTEPRISLFVVTEKMYCNMFKEKSTPFSPHTASVLSRVTCVQTNLDEDSEAVRDEFHNFLAKVISNWTDKRDQEELSIMNTRHK